MVDLKIDRTNLILYCSNWEKTLEFYSKTLNLVPAFENSWLTEFEINEKAYISIANASKTTIRPNYGKGITITFRIPDADQLTKLNEDLIRKKAQTTQIQKKWGAVLFYCFDPEGNRLEFWTDIPK